MKKLRNTLRFFFLVDKSNMVTFVPPVKFLKGMQLRDYIIALKHW